VAADKGKKLHAVVTGRKAGYAATSLQSNPRVFNFDYKISGKPRILTNHPMVGANYEAETAYVTALKASSVRPDKLTYQWNLDGKPVKGATKSTYKVASADYGKKLSVTVRAQARGYTPAINTSAQTTPITKGYAAPKRGLYVAGEAKVGSTLEVSDGQWLTGAKLSYQWYYRLNGTIGWKPISGATESTYTIGSTYAGKQIRVQVTGSKAGYLNGSTKSTSTNRIVR
jgi:hypothetical protein